MSQPLYEVDKRFWFRSLMKAFTNDLNACFQRLKNPEYATDAKSAAATNEPAPEDIELPAVNEQSKNDVQPLPPSTPKSEILMVIENDNPAWKPVSEIGFDSQDSGYSDITQMMNILLDDVINSIQEASVAVPEDIISTSPKEYAEYQPNEIIKSSKEYKLLDSNEKCISPKDSDIDTEAEGQFKEMIVREGKHGRSWRLIF